MRFEDIAGLDFNIGDITRTFEQKGQNKLYALSLYSANNRKKLVITYPTKIGDVEVEAFLEKSTKLGFNKGDQIVSIVPIQTRKGVGLNILGIEEKKYESGRNFVNSHGLWFKAKDATTYLKIEDFAVRLIDITKETE